MEAHGFVIRNKSTGNFLQFYEDGNGDPYVEFHDNLLLAKIFADTGYFLSKGRRVYTELFGLELESVPITIKIELEKGTK